jgi:hypothetical protein
MTVPPYCPEKTQKNKHSSQTEPSCLILPAPEKYSGDLDILYHWILPLGRWQNARIITVNHSHCQIFPKQVA